MEEKLVEKTFFVMECNKINKHHRIYPKTIVEKWVDLSCKDDSIIDIEYSIFNDDLDFEYIKESQVCGIIKNLYFEGENLFATAVFDLNKPEFEYFYNNESAFEKCTIVARGSGTVRNQTVQDDYELIGFDLILKDATTSYLAGRNLFKNDGLMLEISKIIPFVSG